MAARKPAAREHGPLERAARAALHESAKALALLEARNAPAVAAAAELIMGCFENGGTVFFCGNGGSAADAQHLAAEFSGRYLVDRPGLPAVALTSNSSAVTAIGNDYGYDQVFSRQLEGIAAPGDVLVAITTSGRSESIRRAVKTAHAMQLMVIGMTGAKGGEFAALCDVALITPSAVTPNIQEGHIAMGHAFCLLVERSMFPDGAPGRGPIRARRAKRETTNPRMMPILQALRPKQWTKNLLVFAGVVFAQHASDPALLLRALAGFVAFSLLASAVYVVNDLKDVDVDRLHPRKRHRPIASGALSPAVAWSVVPVLLVIVAALCSWLGFGFMLVLAAYLASNVAYSFGLKNQVILDVFVIASGFVLRAVAGVELLKPWRPRRSCHRGSSCARSSARCSSPSPSAARADQRRPPRLGPARGAGHLHARAAGPDAHDRGGVHADVVRALHHLARDRGQVR
jgi:D-sedoheptulose 7-phosphate isomerase